MKAVCRRPDGGVEINDIPQPSEAAEGHIVVQMERCEINPGDKFFLTQPTSMSLAGSLHDVWGVSGFGKVVSVGVGSPKRYQDQMVVVYRSLHVSPNIIGTWSEYAQLPYLSCAIVPAAAIAPEVHPSSLVNLITPYAFAKQVMNEGHKGIVVTAGSSATGRAMIAIADALNVPVVSLIRNAKNEAHLEKLGAKNVVVVDDPAFEKNFAALTVKLQATAIFEGLGGEMINRIVPLLPPKSVISSYGQLAGPGPMTVPLNLLMAKDLTVKSFSNFRSATVRDPKQMEEALTEISKLLHTPSFQAEKAKEFGIDEIDAALAFTGTGHGKAVLMLH